MDLDVNTAFIQLAPSGHATPFQCAVCGACILVTHLEQNEDFQRYLALEADERFWKQYDGRQMHLDWHRSDVRYLHPPVNTRLENF